MEVSQKIKHRTTMLSSNSTSGYITQRIKSTDSNRYLYTHVTAALFTIIKRWELRLRLRSDRRERTGVGGVNTA